MKEFRKEDSEVNIKEEIIRLLKYILPVAPVSAIFVAVVFAAFMYARTMKDERISGFFGLLPIFLLILVFWGWFIINFVRDKK